MNKLVVDALSASLRIHSLRHNCSNVLLVVVAYDLVAKALHNLVPQLSPVLEVSLVLLPDLAIHDVVDLSLDEVILLSWCQRTCA